MGLGRIMLDGNSAVGCWSGSDCFELYLCCRLRDWNGFCWKVTVLYAVGLERIVLDGFFALCCGFGRDCFAW